MAHRVDEDFGPGNSDRIARLEERISDLEGIIQSLVVSVNFDESEPFDALCAKHMISGQRRVATQMQISIMLTRQTGESVGNYPDVLLPDYPSVSESKRQNFSSHEDMAQALAPVVGSPELAASLIEAYEKRGLGNP